MKTRRAYIDLLAAKLKEWDAKIDQLRWKADAGNAKMKIAYNKRLDELGKKREKAEAVLTRLQEATDEKWTDVKKDADKIIENVKRFFRKAA